MLTLVLTRHGSTPRSDPEQHLGQHLDLPLSDVGRSAAAALGGRLAGLQFDRVVASPLRRSRETAALVVPSADVELDPRLIEMDYGRWEGLTYDEIEAADSEARRRWEADPARLHCPGGESGDEVAARVTAFLDDLLAWTAAAPMTGAGRCRRAARARRRALVHEPGPPLRCDGRRASRLPAAVRPGAREPDGPRLRPGAGSGSAAAGGQRRVAPAGHPRRHLGLTARGQARGRRDLRRSRSGRAAKAATNPSRQATKKTHGRDTGHRDRRVERAQGVARRRPSWRRGRCLMKTSSTVHGTAPSVE